MRTYKRTIYVAYNDHKQSAKKRGIDFQFTLEQWIKWWEDNLGSDWFSLRGRKRGQYVMARCQDKGSYHPDNVGCVTNTVNHLERYNPKFNGAKRLTKQEAIEIFKMKGTQNSIAKRYKVSARLVRMIKAKEVWKHIHDRQGKP